MADCIFCKIASGEIPGEIVYQDDRLIAFKDVSPAAPVHVLIIPKSHVASLNEMHDFDLAGEMLKVCVKLASDLGIKDKGYRVVINTGEAGGQTVKHLHMHLLGDRNLGWPPG